MYQNNIIMAGKQIKINICANIKKKSKIYNNRSLLRILYF